MSLRGKVEEMWYDPGEAGGLLGGILIPFAFFFRLGTHLRNTLYDTGIRPSRSAPVPCISVGNLVAGGTGKTPLTRWIAGFYLLRGMSPAVISRGYRGQMRGPAVVAGGADAGRLYGDEPAMLARLQPSVPVVVGRDRVAAGGKAVEACGAGVLVADDAFQHRGLRRALNIVTVDAVRFLGNGRMLPRGPLREPASALRRADVLVLTRVSAAGDSLPGKRTLLRQWAPAADIVEADLVPSSWRRFGDQLWESAEPPRGKIFAFCGIANPGSFILTLGTAGGVVKERRFFPDHHHYSVRELEDLARSAEKAGAAAAVTTAKDAVRIGGWPGKVPLYILDVELRLVAGEDTLEEQLVAAAEGEGR